MLGIESSLPLAVLAEACLRREGSRRSRSATPTRATCSGELPAGSVDVVLFDPMFGRALAAQPGFEMLRRLANPSPLKADVLADARRVARRAVLVKAARYAPMLRSLGLHPEHASRSAPVVWARIPTVDGG